MKITTKLTILATLFALCAVIGLCRKSRIPTYDPQEDFE